MSLATVGVVIGLGSAWRLPLLLDQYGGGAFLLVYVGVLLLVGLPVLMAELMIGRRGRTSPAGCYDRVARDEGRPCEWRWVAAVGGLAGVLMLAAGSVLAAQAGLLLFRVGEPASAAVGILPGASTTALGQLGFFAFIGAVAAARTTTRAKAEVVVAALVAVLLVLLTFDVVRIDPSLEGVRRLLQPRFARLGWSGAAEATRLAILTLGLTLGTVIAHGATLPASRSILRTSGLLLLLAAATVCLALVLVATVLNRYRMPPLHGSPLLLGQLPAVLTPESGRIRLWYGFIAAGGAAGGLAVLHSVVEQLVSRYRMRRGWAVLWAAGGAWVLGVLAMAPGAGWGAAELLGSFATDILFPGATVGLALFAGWAMSRRATRSELGMRRPPEFLLWRALIRYVTPALVGVVLVTGVARLIAG